MFASEIKTNTNLLKTILMKTIIRKSVIAATIALSLAATSFSATAKTLVYDKQANPNIGITVENATGATFTIKDEKGNIVLSGTVKNDKTFFISTQKLEKGTYKFYIGSFVIQEFAIK